MSNLKFSVAMSLYKKDDPKNFDTALKSITEDQTVKPDEIVLIVDGPVSEELNGVIDKYAKLFDIFNVVRLPENKGLGNALKIAVESAKYDVVARMDSDDISLPDRFEKQIGFMCEHPDIDVLGTDISEFIDTPENIVGIRSVLKNHNEIVADMKKRCAVNHVTVMYKKQSVLKAGGYLDWFSNEDYYLWIRMMLCGAKFANISENLVNVRVGKDMYNRRGGIKYFKSEAGIQKYMLQNKIIGLPIYIVNVLKRLIVQVLLPNRLRGWVFKKFAREKK